MSIDAETVRKVALLARLEIDPSEEPRLVRELASILSYVEQLQALDVTGIEPTSQVGGEAKPALREDVAKPCETREEALGQAPDRDGDYFRVPQVV
ncbi:MAG: Asp-tRNA(Asn)/Glu-tRNA(Gln) amidotransferase subunit GatC [Candidatus Latescibacteria bacterium]|nr:Asp-tRNA(Asn)/Glu-tRNA(Gln) amidotransferase subunit GatC [Candidatus Latescibacterota bacterium]